MKTRDVVVLCAALVLGAAAPLTAAESAAAPRATPAHASKASTVSADEARIAELHAKLRITPAQEDLWKNVAEVMRANATAMEPLRKARSEKAPTMTAVEDFTSYAEIASVHADGIKNFVPVFAALYESMSDAQKKNTDTVFRRGAAPKASAKTGAR